MANLFDKDKLVRLLGAADFQDEEPSKLKSKRCHAVLFFANWCGHCRDLKPIYSDFADTALFIKVAAVDTDANANLMKNINKSAKIGREKAEIRGFPTIWFYKAGEPVLEYQGDRNTQSLVATARQICNEKCKCHEIEN